MLPYILNIRGQPGNNTSLSITTPDLTAGVGGTNSGREKSTE